MHVRIKFKATFLNKYAFGYFQISSVNLPNINLLESFEFNHQTSKMNTLKNIFFQV